MTMVGGAYGAGATTTVGAASIYEVADDDELQQLCRDRGWTDGLPVQAPTPERVAACLDWSGLAPDHVLGVDPVKERVLTAAKVAVNAVLAGCLPVDFPVVATAV